MRSIQAFILVGLVGTGIVSGLACSSEADDEDGVGASGSTAATGTGNTKGTGTTGPSSSTGMQTSTVELTGDITASQTLSADTLYILKGVVKVAAGATLTIEKGTVIQGDKATLGTLVIQQGAKIMAVGTADEPIVFTSRLAPGSRAPGDWGGVILLGKAPINTAGGTASIEGLSTNEIYGGADAADSSGTMQYVRIEFSGVELSPDNEINGLTMGGVGTGTVIDHIMVKQTLDDCFEWFGGTVNAKYLVCSKNGDDAFDIDRGYGGKLQFLFAQKDPAVADTANGFEFDNSADDIMATPVTNPTISNVTLCGPNAEIPKEQYGMLLREGTHATIMNAYVTGFEGGVDLRDNPATSVTLTNSVFVGNAPENIAYAEDGSNEAEQKDDDGGVDERTWFTGGTGNAEAGAALADCYAQTPDPRPATEIPGGAVPAGFDAAPYVGAFKDANDMWMTGAWVDFAAN